MSVDEKKDSPQSPSRLSPTQKRLLLVVIGLSVFMLADTLYLLINRLADLMRVGYFAVTDTSLPKFYQAMVLSHTGVGLVLLVVAVGFVIWHLPAVWRRNKTQAIYTGILTLGLGLVLGVTGLFILTAANSRENAWAFWSHVGAALLLPLFYLLHRRVSLWKPSAHSYRRVPAAIAALTLLAVALHGLTYDREQYTQAAEKAFAEGTNLGPGSKQRQTDEQARATYGFVPANYVPFQSPFFPAATTTTTGAFLPSRIITRGDLSLPEKLQRDIERYGFVATEKIGAETCARCHAAITEQWSRSAHRFASFNNPFYEATITHMRSNSNHGNPEVAAHLGHYPELAGKEAKVKSKWCSGCHDPAVMLAGQMTEDFDRNSPQAQAGLTCLACHAIDQIHNRTGNGNYNIADEQEDPYLFPQAQAGVGAMLHDVALKARPLVHKRQMLKPFFRTSEFCGTCHKVSLDTRLNGYRWVRGQNEYDNWHDSGVAHNASRTFYLPPAKKICQECHMPSEKAVEGDVSAKDGFVRSHRFLAVNTALPFLRGDTTTIRLTEAFLQDEKLRVDVFALRRASGETVYALDRTRPSLSPGEEVQLEVVVRNKGVGHTFPGGTNDSNEGWLEFSALDEAGRQLALSGAVRPDGHVDPDAHFYKALMVDRHGQAIHMRNAQDIVTSVYVRVIGPGTADAAHYSFRLPQSYHGAKVTFRARLLWRKFDRAYTEFAYHNNRRAFANFDKVPDLPVSTIAENEVTLPVGAPDPTAESPRPEDWMRFNDYGIGLLLQEDTQGALKAFEQVATLAPKRLDGPRNLARAAFQDGNLENALEYLRQSEALVPGDAQSAWVWGLTLQEDGRYPEAALAYRRVLHFFPEDRGAWRNLGRVLYLDGKFAEALEALDQTLAIDQEDRVAHYHRMLSLRALGRQEEAAQAEAAYEYFQIDESAQEMTRTYRLANPADNRETQGIHVHPLTPEGQSGT
ncbi:MAG: tetratricopeptide repeat protein [Candidatus Handelsmanbacteria bacterium]|nr:tetratricopeptide repeat protein [Candidatus Handelsmanbacteria bacterium]